MRTQEIPAHLVTVQQIIILVANRFRLPIEYGYQVNAGQRYTTTPLALTICVTVPEWGLGSSLVFSIERGEHTMLWCPMRPSTCVLRLVYGSTLPQHLQGYIHTLEISRKSPNERNVWPAGKYPRFQIRVKSTRKIR